MRSSERRRIGSILSELSERPPEEREQALERLVGGDQRLRRQVLELYRRAGRAPGPEAEERVPALRRAGDRIGPYCLVELLGRGGMGEVWLAEREDGQFHKRVALKLVSHGPTQLEALERFRRERQVLASLEHEGIARLLDGGATLEGIPYYVMEYVDGEPIDVHCRKRGLGVRERVELFLQVCDAVRHAHANLVVHRDLKPSNVLVTPDGRAKLLDFGIAKLLDADEAASLLTLVGQRCMTPRYASPEQVRGEAVGTPSDVYSLGVLLYELLAGASPYGADLTPTELLEAVCEREPRRPSTRLLARDDGEGRSAAEARSRGRRLRGDLDNIVLAALRKERARRYPSVEALAEDLQRHLDGLPVRARPNTALYLATRFVRRNRWPIAAGAALLLSLVAGLAVSIRLYLRAEQEREEATWQAYVASIAAVDAALGDEHRAEDAGERLARAPVALRGWEWDYQSARLDRSLLALEAARNALTVGLSPDGRTVVSVSGFPGKTCVLEAWDVATGAPLLAAEGHADFARDLAFSPDGSRIATVSSDHSVHLWSLATGALERVIDPGLGPLACAVFHPDGRRLAVAGPQGTIAVLDADSGRTLRELTGHVDAVRDLLYSDDGARLLSAGRDGTAREWDPQAGDELRRFAAGAPLIALALSEPDDRLVLLRADSMAVRLRLSDGERLSEVRGPPAVVDRGALSADGRLAAVPCDDRSVRVWETRFGEVVGELRGNTDNAAGVWGLAFSADCTRVATSTWDHSVRVWDVDGTPPQLALRAHTSAVLGLAAHPDGERLASCSRDGTVRLWNARAGLLLRTLRGHPRWVECVDFSRDGALLVSGASDDAALLWDPTTGELTARIEQPTRSAGFSPAADLLALGTPDGRIVLHPLDGAASRTLQGPACNVRDLGFSADGVLLGSLHDRGGKQARGHLVLWDVASGAELARRDVDARPISLAFVPGEGGLVMTGIERDGGRLVDLALPELTPRASWAIPNVWTLGDLAVSAGRRRVAVPTSQNTVRLWDPTSRREVGTLREHGAIVWASTWSPDGSWLAASSSDRSVRVWSTRSARDDHLARRVGRLFEREPLVADVVRRIEQDPWLSEDHKREGVRIARSRVDDLDELRRCARVAAWREDADVGACRRALAVARALGRAQADDAEAWLLEGVLLFRLDALEEACGCLRRVLEEAGRGPLPVAATADLYLAMTRCRLDEPGARAALEELVARLQADPLAEALPERALPEARRLLAGG
jgi:WD40 repeat protein